MTPDVLEPERPYLRGVAYRLLGSAADAEDVVQEAFVKARELDDVRTPRALLTTIVTRLCLDELRSARRRREHYVGPWLPDPVLTDADADGEQAPARPDDRVDAAESVSIAFLLLLETLSPHERAVFVLREVLDLEFAEIADAIDKTEAACRQLLHRAREHVAARRRRFPRRADQDQLASRFITALATGDVAAMIDLMIDDAAAISDHGGKAKAATRPVLGADRVARFIIGLASKLGPHRLSSEAARINGSPALIVRDGATIYAVVILDTVVVDGEARLAGLHLIRNPDKLGTALPRLG